MNMKLDADKCECLTNVNVCLLPRPYQYMVAPPCPDSLVWSAGIETSPRVLGSCDELK